MVAAGAGDDFLVNDGVGDVLAQTKAYAAAGTGVDEIIHGAGVEGVLAVDELWQQVYIPLLGLRLVTRFGRRSQVLRSLVRTMPAAATAADRSLTEVSLLSEQNTP